MVFEKNNLLFKPPITPPRKPKPGPEEQDNYCLSFKEETGISWICFKSKRALGPLRIKAQAVLKISISFTLFVFRTKPQIENQLKEKSTWNLFLTTSRGWQTAFAHVPAAKPQMKSWKLDTCSSPWIALEDLRWFQAYKHKSNCERPNWEHLLHLTWGEVVAKAYSHCTTNKLIIKWNCVCELLTHIYMSQQSPE